MDRLIRMVLVDDSPIVRVGLRRLFEEESGITIVGEAGSGNEAISMIENLMPDVIILDCQLPEISGVEVAKTVHQRSPQTKIVAFSVHDDEMIVHGMVEAGAVSYLIKDEPSENIIQSVYSAVRGAGWFSPAAAARLAQWARRVPNDLPRLTERERDVLRLLSSGKTNHAMGLELQITERTVRFHMRNIYDKIGVHTRAEAVVWAMHHGLSDE